MPDATILSPKVIAKISEVSYDISRQELCARGWCLSSDGAITLNLVINRAVIEHAEIRTGLPRPDVIDKFLEFDDTHCGWELTVKVDIPANISVVSILALSDNKTTRSVGKIDRFQTDPFAPRIQTHRADTFVPLAFSTIRGIHPLQRYVRAFGNNIINAFDIDAWRRATNLHHLGVRLVVRHGDVTLSLRHVGHDARVSELIKLAQSGPGTLVCPPIHLGDFSGAFVPVVTHTSQGANFDIYFATDDVPETPHAHVNYIFCTFKRAEYMQHNADVFRDYLRIHKDHAAAHLSVVDNGSVDGSNDCGVSEDDHVTVFPNNNTGGAGGFGRGLYEACYGALADKNFTHVCLLDDDIYLNPEMFARNTAFMRFLKPGFHVGAPMYPTSSPEHAPRTSACFGHKHLGTVHPNDQALGGGLDTGDIAAFLTMDREPDSTGWWWDCMAVRDIHRIGLPYPFFIKMDDVEYSLRLRDVGVKLVIPFSFWVLHDDFEEKYSAAMQYFRFRNRWVLLAQQGRLEDVADFRDQFWSLVRGYIGARKYEHAQLLLNAMEDFLKGPEYLIEKVAKNALALPPPVAQGDGGAGSHLREFLLKLRLKMVLRRVESRLRSGLSSNYAAARKRLTTIPYWSQFADNQPAADPVLRTPDMGLEIVSLQTQLNISRFEIEQLHRNLHQSRQDITETLARNHLLHSPQILADLERANLVALSLLHKRHAGRRAFIVGNGPSLKIADLDRLHGEITFASNKIYLAFEDTTWRPDFYSVEDSLVLQNNRDRITALQGTTKIFPANMRDFGHHSADTIFVPFHAPKSFDDPLSDPEFPEFSTDLRHGIGWGSTIVYSQIQMALFMGCRDIYLIGIDHDYHLPSVKRGRFYISEDEKNHFHPEYREVGEKWHQPNLDVLEISYARARDRCADQGVRVLNASRKTRLQVFDLIDFDTLF